MTALPSRHPNPVFTLTSSPPHSPRPPSVPPDHASLLFHVKTFVSDIRSLSCQLAILQGNGEEAGGAAPTLILLPSPWAAAQPPPPLPAPSRLPELLPCELGGARRQLLLVLAHGQALAGG